jgi:hypothetical protein
LRLSPLAELNCGKDQPARDGERRQRLEHDLKKLELGGHGESYKLPQP